MRPFASRLNLYVLDSVANAGAATAHQDEEDEMNQNSYSESGNSPPRRRENNLPLSAPTATGALATSLQMSRPFSDRSDSARHNLLADMLHIHDRLYRYKAKDAPTDESREAGVLASEVWKRIIEFALHEMPPRCSTKCCVRCSRPEPPRFRGDSLSASDVLEVRENTVRIGLHTDKEQCYCKKCLETRSPGTVLPPNQRRNEPGLSSKIFQQQMEERGFSLFAKLTILINLQPCFLPPPESQDRLRTTWIDSAGKKYIATNIRCKVCGALDGLKYRTRNILGIRKTKVCSVSESYLCDRDLCLASRRFKREFEPIRLFIGYEDHPFYKSPVHPSLRLWANKVDGNSPTDPNLSCELRYEQHGRGRKDIKSKTHEFGGSGGIAQPSPIHTAEITDQIILRAEEIFHATYKDVVVPTQDIVKVKFNENVHKIVHYSWGASFEEKRHIPNYNYFGPRGVERECESDLEVVAPFDSFEVHDYGVARTSVWFGDPKDWKPGYGLPLYPLGKAFIIQGSAPYYTPEYRDPNVSKLKELDTWKTLKEEFKAWCAEKNAKDDTGGWVWTRSGRRWIRHKGWRWYSNPNTLNKRSIITTLRNTHGGEDEIRQKQLKKLEEMKKQGLAPIYVEDIYLRGKSRKQIAEEQKISKPTLTKRVQRHLNKPVVTEDSQWAKAISRSKCDRDGVYATASLGGHTKAYLILPVTEFVGSFDDNWKLPQGDLHNVIRDILKHRDKNSRMKDEDNRFPDYYEVYKQFIRFGWRVLWHGKWYREDLTEIPVLSAT